MNPTYENGAWIYIGNSSKLNTELVFRTIHEYILSDTIHIAHTRTASVTVTHDTIKEALSSLLGHHDFFLWDINFKKAIEFNNTNDVFRCGEFE